MPWAKPVYDWIPPAIHSFCLADLYLHQLVWADGQGAWEATLIAILIWAITLVIAYVLEKANLRGPFESVHRRLSYGRTGQLNQFTTQ